MRSAQPQPHPPILPAAAAQPGGVGHQAAHRRGVHGMPLLRLTQDHRGAPEGNDHQPQGGPAPHARDPRTCVVGRCGHRRHRPGAQHQVFPYLWRHVTASYPNHIWGIDITYIRLMAGWVYLVAVLDWFSRYVIAWELSDTLALPFVLECAQRALAQATPQIWNSDQGSP